MNTKYSKYDLNLKVQVPLLRAGLMGLVFYPWQVNDPYLEKNEGEILFHQLLMCTSPKGRGNWNDRGYI